MWFSILFLVMIYLRAYQVHLTIQERPQKPKASVNTDFNTSQLSGSIT